jgi:hypothetical protein
MVEIWNTSWLNENLQRRYPLMDGTSAIDETGAFELPNDVIVDFSATIHQHDDLDPIGFHIGQVVVLSQGITLTVSYLGTPIATLSVLSATHTQYRTYQASIVNDDFEDATIKLMIGKLDSILQLTAGSWSFTQDSTRLLPTLIRPDLRGVSAVYLRNGNGLSNPLHGNVELVAGTNVRLRTGTNLIDGRSQIHIDAIDGEGLNQDCECSGAKLSDPIRSINGIRPNDMGELSLLGDSCLDVSSGANTIQLKDVCSKPCCGCNELEVVQTAAQEIANKVATIEAFAQRLDALVTQMQNVLLASKIECTPS